MKINDREYTIPELNFNAMCELEDLGASFSEMDKKVLSTVRAFLALAMGGDAEKAGKEIEAHIASGGKFARHQQSRGGKRFFSGLKA